MLPALTLLSTLLLLPVRVELVASPEAPPDAALSWRAWTPGQGEEARATGAADSIGGAGPRTLVAELPGEGPWRIVVEGESGGDTWLAVPGESGRAHLVAIPVPDAAWTEDGATLTWELPRPAADVLRGIHGWQVLRGAPGREAELVGQVAAGATRFVDELADEIADEGATWALRPLLADGVTGRAGRYSEPATD